MAFNFNPDGTEVEPSPTDGLDVDPALDNIEQQMSAAQGEAPVASPEQPGRPPRMNRPPRVLGAENRAAAEAVVESLEETAEAVEAAAEADGIAEMDARLEVISYYRVLLSQPLFETYSDAAHRVEADIRRFVKRQLEVALGQRPVETAPSKPVPVQLPFTKAEVEALKSLTSLSADDVTALKMLSAKVLERSASTAKAPAPPPPPPQPPALRQVQADPAARVQVAPSRQKAPARSFVPTAPPSPLQPRGRVPGPGRGNGAPPEPVVRRQFREVETVDGTGTRKMDVTKQVMPPPEAPQPLPMPQGPYFEAAMGQLAANTLAMGGAITGAKLGPILGR